MQENTKPLVFGYLLWNKIVFIVFAVLSGWFLYIFLTKGALEKCFINGNVILGLFVNVIATCIMFILILDFSISRVFSKVIISKNEFVYKPGGFIWKWFFKRKFSSQSYKIYIHYWVDYFSKPDAHLYTYLRLYIVDKKYNRTRFILFKTYPQFRKIIETVEDFYSDYERVRDYTFLDWLDDKFDR
ncbi:MAG: hypothetical protein PHE49_04020 [bacterium]|nr:hypothetical protein [bacterium]